METVKKVMLGAVDPLEVVLKIKGLRERICVRGFGHEDLVREYLYILELMNQAAGAMELLDAGSSKISAGLALRGAPWAMSPTGRGGMPTRKEIS